MLTDKKYYTDLETSKLLKEFGYNEPCDAEWSNCVVKEAFFESNDGFFMFSDVLSFLKTEGGELEWEEIYENGFNFELEGGTNFGLNDDKLLSLYNKYNLEWYSAPLLQDILSFIREVLYYEIQYERDANGYWIVPKSLETFQIIDIGDVYGPFETWEEAMNKGIRIVVKYEIETNGKLCYD